MSETSPEVTIIIPHYNAWEYLPRAIESAKAQTVPCEIIVIDQCSDERGFPWSPLYDGVTSVRQGSKLSWPVTLNQGVRMATTKWIVPLNADDTIAPSMVERCLNAAEDDAEPKIVFPSCLPLDSRVFENNRHAYCALISRGLWSTLGGYREVGLADWDFWIRLYRRDQAIGEPQACAGDGLFHWTDRPDGQTAIMRADGSLQREIEATRERWKAYR